MTGPIIHTPQFEKIEKIGAKSEGADVYIMLGDKEARLPWAVAQQLANIISRCSLEARKNDPKYLAKVQELRESHA